MSQERKEKIFNLFDEKSQPEKNGNTVGSVCGNTLSQGAVVINGNVTFHDKKKQDSEFLTDSQAYEIQQLIYKLADLDIACGFTTTGQASARRKWWYVLRAQFKTTSYKLIPYSCYGSVIQFLNSHLTKMLYTQTEANSNPWRNKCYSAIYAKCKETGTTKEQLYKMADNYLDSSVISLKQLSDNNLKHLYNIIVQQ